MSPKATILVAEDELPLRAALHDKLSTQGFTVLEASNGEEGLALALAHQPSLILLDVLMPKMDGLTMLKQLRQDPRGKNIQVIMLSNFSDNDKVAEALQSNVNYYLVKADWPLDKIVQIVHQHLTAN